MNDETPSGIIGNMDQGQLEQVASILTEMPTDQNGTTLNVNTVLRDTICSLAACFAGLFVGGVFFYLTSFSHVAIIIAALGTAAAVRYFDRLGRRAWGRKKRTEGR